MTNFTLSQIRDVIKVFFFIIIIFEGALNLIHVMPRPDCMPYRVQTTHSSGSNLEGWAMSRHIHSRNCISRSR